MVVCRGVDAVRAGSFLKDGDQFPARRGAADSVLEARPRELARRGSAGAVFRNWFVAGLTDVVAGTTHGRRGRSRMAVFFLAAHPDCRPVDLVLCAKAR